MEWLLTLLKPCSQKLPVEEHYLLVTSLAQSQAVRANATQLLVCLMSVFRVQVLALVSITLVILGKSLVCSEPQFLQS